MDQWSVWRNLVFSDKKAIHFLEFIFCVITTNSHPLINFVTIVIKFKRRPNILLKFYDIITTY